MRDFPLPDAALRTKLWEGILPKGAPKGDIDYALLGTHLELSGAGIKNSALNGAYLAAVKGEKISITHLVDGARIEYQKDGKTFPSILEYYI